MDEKFIEIADALTTSIIEAGISASRNAQKRPEGFEGFCSCGAEIQPKRVEAGYYNCITCQERIEGRKKFFG